MLQIEDILYKCQMWDLIQEFKNQSIFTIYTEWKSNWKYRYEIINSNNYKNSISNKFDNSGIK